MNQRERDVIVSCQKGDKESFGLLYDEHIRTIYNFIFYKVFDKEVVEDLTSQTFMKALKNIHKVDPDRPFRSWLYRIAQNTVIDHFRAKRNHEDIDDVWDISDDTDLVQELDSARDVVALKKHLSLLPSSDRDIIFMRVWEEMSYKEIAEVVGKTEAGTKMAYSRALEKLRSIVPIALYMLLASKL